MTLKAPFDSIDRTLSPPQVTALLDKLCVELGFCLPREDYERLEQSPPADIDSFTKAVFLAEGLDPETERLNLYRQVRATVAEAFKKALTEADGNAPGWR